MKICTIAPTRRAVVMLAMALPFAARAATPLRIGYQKNGALVILRQQRRLDPLGVAVEWVEFASGPPILEALNAGAIDFAATGDTPPIFAQAAGADLLYVGGQPITGVKTTAEGVAPSNSFFLARRAYADQQPATILAVLDAINGAAQWAREHPEELSRVMTEVTGVPIAAQRVAAPRGVYAVQPMDDTIVAQQQAIADSFADLHIIPARIQVRAAVWTPPHRASGSR